VGRPKKKKNSFDASGKKKKEKRERMRLRRVVFPSKGKIDRRYGSVFSFGPWQGGEL